MKRRWRYEDVRLGLPCRFELTIDDTTYVSSSGDMLLSMGMAGTAHLVSVEHKGAEAFATLMVEGSSPLVIGTLSANFSGAVGGSDSGPTTLLGPVTLEVTESTTDLMVGHASGSIQSLAPPYQSQEMVPFSVRFEIGLDEEASDQFAAIGGAGMLARGMAGGAAFDPSAMAGMDLSRLMGGMTGQVVGVKHTELRSNARKLESPPHPRGQLAKARRLPERLEDGAAQCEGQQRVACLPSSHQPVERLS